MHHVIHRLPSIEHMFVLLSGARWVLAGLARRCDDGRAVDFWQAADEDKLAELILYVADRIRDDPTGGATKINKILYFAEFAHIRSHGSPITGAVYQRLPRGPAPRRLPPVRQRLIESGAAELDVDTYFGYPLHRLLPKRPADVAKFSKSEIQAVDQVVDALRGKTAEEVSHLSHQEKAWQLVETYEDIPFSAAFLAAHSVVTEDTRHHAELLADKLGISH